jgi:ZIP family zinc transporter
VSGIGFALGLTLLAGMATGVGSLIAFFAPRTNYRFLSIATGFSAGVMLYVAFVEILAKGEVSLSLRYGDTLGSWINVGSFFSGILLIGLIDLFIPESENPHEVHSEKELRKLQPLDPSFSERHPVKPPGHIHEPPPYKLMRMGLFTALAITIHNFPEGAATFLAALHDPAIGIAIATAIALHNIPEGISVSVPIYYATGNRKKALCYSLLSGLAEPVGALGGFLLLYLFVGSGSAEVIPPEIMGILFGGVAGIMVYISLDELLPTSHAYGKGHDSLLGVAGGMAVMALSLLLLQ